MDLGHSRPIYRDLGMDRPLSGVLGMHLKHSESRAYLHGTTSGSWSNLTIMGGHGFWSFKAYLQGSGHGLPFTPVCVCKDAILANLDQI